MKETMKELMLPIKANQSVGYPLLALMVLASLYWPYFWFHDLPSTTRMLNMGTINVPQFGLWMLPVQAIITDLMSIAILASLTGSLGQRPHSIETLRTALIIIGSTALLTFPLCWAIATLNPNNLSHNTPLGLFAGAYFVAGVYLALSCGKLMMQSGFMWIVLAISGAKVKP